MTKSVVFTPASHPRHITVDFLGNVLEVTSMYDKFGEDTSDPALALACVVALPDGRWWSATTDEVPIYTVH